MHAVLNNKLFNESIESKVCALRKILKRCNYFTAYIRNGLL